MERFDNLFHPCNGCSNHGSDFCLTKCSENNIESEEEEMDEGY